MIYYKVCKFTPPARIGIMVSEFDRLYQAESSARKHATADNPLTVLKCTEQQLGVYRGDGRANAD